MESMNVLMSSPLFKDTMDRMFQQFASSLPAHSPQTDRDHPGPVYMPAPLPPRIATPDREEEERLLDEGMDVDDTDGPTDEMGTGSPRLDEEK